VQWAAARFVVGLCVSHVIKPIALDLSMSFGFAGRGSGDIVIRGQIGPFSFPLSIMNTCRAAFPQAIR
jgi:hypothetical protein